jgi:hypothetical protein
MHTARLTPANCLIFAVQLGNDLTAAMSFIPAASLGSQRWELVRASGRLVARNCRTLDRCQARAPLRSN